MHLLANTERHDDVKKCAVAAIVALGVSAPLPAFAESSNTTNPGATISAAAQSKPMPTPSVWNNPNKTKDGGRRFC